MGASTDLSAAAGKALVPGELGTLFVCGACSAADAVLATEVGTPRQWAPTNSRVDLSAPTTTSTTSSPAATIYGTLARRLLGTAARRASRNAGGRMMRPVSVEVLQLFEAVAGATSRVGEGLPRRGRGGGADRRTGAGLDGATEGAQAAEREGGREIVMVMRCRRSPFHNLYQKGCAAPARGEARLPGLDRSP